tara:strand:+ start:880 stop:1680 length:801 start_codon:yes stop_codon:yes gene_type:complete
MSVDEKDGADKAAKMNGQKLSDVFKPVAESYRRRGLKIAISGPPESGKTYFGLSAPGPVYVISTEFGVSQVTHHFKDKEIHIVEANVFDPDSDAVDPLKSLDMVEKAIKLLRTVDKGTIIIDSITDIWGWVQHWLHATAEKKKSAGGKDYMPQFEWGKANERYRFMIMRLLSRPTHFIATARVKPEYGADGKITGGTKPGWQQETPYFADIQIDMTKKTIGNVTQYLSTISKCRFQRQYNKTLKDLTFPILATELKGVIPPEITLD